MILLGEEQAAAIREHGRNAYPEECCGALLGASDGDGGGAARVELVRPMDNVREDERRRRFLVEPRAYLAAERAARERGLELLGFYHSHPDHPAEPSRFDRLHAWPNLHYAIVAVAAGEPRELTSWLLTEDRSAMRPERVVIAPASAVALSSRSATGAEGGGQRAVAGDAADQDGAAIAAVATVLETPRVVASAAKQPPEIASSLRSSR